MKTFSNFKLFSLLGSCIFLLSSCDDNAFLKFNLSSQTTSAEQANGDSGTLGGGYLVKSPNGYSIKTGIRGISSMPKTCNNQGVCAQISISR